VREILSLGAWIGASLVTLYYFPDVTEMVMPQVKNEQVASGLAAMGTFAVALVIISMINSIILRYIKDGAEVGLLDNAMGLMFGLARGVLLIAIAYFIFTIVVAKDSMPEWMEKAETRPYVERAARWVASVAPDYLNEFSPLAKDEAIDPSKPERVKETESVRKLLKKHNEEEPAEDYRSLESLKQKLKTNRAEE
jgi:uncharacterized membrane protein required for colicin V production